MDVSHDALALSTQNVLGANNVRFQQLTSLLGGGDQEVGWQRLRHSDPSLMQALSSAAPATLVSKTLNIITAAGYQVKLDCNMMKTRCGEHIIWAIYQNKPRNEHSKQRAAGTQTDGTQFVDDTPPRSGTPRQAPPDSSSLKWKSFKPDTKKFQQMNFIQY